MISHDPLGSVDLGFRCPTAALCAQLVTAFGLLRLVSAALNMRQVVTR